ncbi:hypothetical protein LA080_005538 [Diaporthe eres]|uniref:Uncharacterized protein n=1 Tax=Diaporthe vaccinii TaxID=105482 RepID=A0ABR4EHP4_9PEZI|nr:hypothetical protein LA080_005538 [Diaporthe eres]
MASITHSMAHELDITVRNLEETIQQLEDANHQLEEANHQLAAARAEITILEDEVARLRQHVPSELRRRAKLPSQTTLCHQHKNIEPSVPRYARATRASEQRSMKPISQAQYPTTTITTITLSVQSNVPGPIYQRDCTRAPLSNKYQYRDGALVKPGYLKDTRSSAAKLRPKIPRRATESDVASTETQQQGFLESSWGDGYWGPNPDHGSHETNIFDEPRKPWRLGWLHAMEQSPLELSDTAYHDLIDLHTLVPATRLEDDKWRETPLKHMYIDDGQQARLLIQGRNVAQKCLWNFVEKRMPGQNPWTGWQQVRFEWGVLSQSWGTASTYYSMLNFRASEAHLVWDTMRRVIQLRHTTSHYSPSSGLFPSSLGEVDEHLKNVQKMAIQLYDEQSALDARRLRDELRQAAQGTFDELVALGTLASLPFAGYPWKHHHECALRRILFTAQDTDECRDQVDEQSPEQTGRIAEDWLLQYGWKGSGYEPPVRLAACVRAPPKRRHSTSNQQGLQTVVDLIARAEADQEWQQRDVRLTLYDVQERLMKMHGEDVAAASSQARRRRTYSG